MAPTVAFAALAPARKVIVCGPQAHGLAAYTAARAVCEHRPVRIICGDNRFDRYAVARFAKSKGVQPETALSSILIARAFTAYQLVELVERLDTHNRLVLITGPCSTLFDEDVPFVNAARLFYRVLWRLVELAREGMTLMLVQREAPLAPASTCIRASACASSSRKRKPKTDRAGFTPRASNRQRRTMSTNTSNC
jgi:hypothetical protein